MRLRVSEQWEDQGRTGKETAVWFCATQNRGELSLKSPMWLYNLKTQLPLCHRSGSVAYSLTAERDGSLISMSSASFPDYHYPVFLSFVLSPTDRFVVGRVLSSFHSDLVLSPQSHDWLDQSNVFICFKQRKLYTASQVLLRSSKTGVRMRTLRLPLLCLGLTRLM